MDIKSKLKAVAKIPSFWPELSHWFGEGNEMVFSPWGMASVNIPTFFRESMSRAAAEMTTQDFQYQETCGNLNLRKAIGVAFANFVRFPNFDPLKNIAVGAGALGVIEFLIKMHIRKPDDEILVFDPIYPLHFIGLREKGVGNSAKCFYNKKTNKFELDFEDFRAKLSEKTKLVILCNPNNPTGRIWTREEYQKITDILKDFPQIKVIEDCAYAVYVNQPTGQIFFHELGDNIFKTYTVFSAGKIFNTTGNRLGWVFAEESLIKYYFNFVHHVYFVSAIEQKIYELSFIESMKPYQGFKNFWEFHADDNIQRMRYLTDGLNKLGIKWIPSEGSYYLLFSCEKLVKKTEKAYFETYSASPQYDPSEDSAVCRKMLIEHHVGILPLSKIIMNEGRQDEWIRVAFNRSFEELDLLLGKLSLLLK